MPVTRFTGKDLVVEWQKTGSPSPVVLTADGRNFEFTHDLNTADGTAGADGYDVELPTTKKASASLELLMNSAATWEDELKVGDSGTLKWYPQGKVAGKPIWGFDALVKSMSQAIPYKDMAKYNVSFANNGSSLLHEGEAFVGP